MKLALVLLSLVSLVDSSRLKRSSALRVKPNGPLLEDLALSADQPVDKKQDSESKPEEAKVEKPAEQKDEANKTSDKASADKEAAEPVKAAKKEVAKPQKEAAEKEAPQPEKEAEKKEDAAKPEPEAKKEAKTEKEAATPEKEAAEKEAAKPEKEAAKKEAEKPEKEEQDAKTAKVEKSPKKDTTDAKKASSSQDVAAESAATTSTTLSVFDAPKVKTATTAAPVSNETLSDYMKECAAQLKAIVKKAEAHYTNEQLVIALQQECDLDKEFPTVRKVFFDRRRDCRQFAEDLGAAREAELKGAANPYVKCCQAAWEEKSQASGLPLASALALLLPFLM